MKAPAIAIKPQEPKKRAVPSDRQGPVIQHASHIAKPQLRFKRKANNAIGLPWTPTLRHKFNAQVPLGYTFQPESDGEHEDGVLYVTLHRSISKQFKCVDELHRPPHPYRYEINNLSYPTHMFQSQTPIQYKSFEETPFTWVSTPVQLSELIDKLRRAREIAVDLEYHSYRTYSGFVCLMQISTREEDWIIDPFELRDELEDLNEVFTNPNIVKAC